MIKTSKNSDEIYYKALIEKDVKFEGTFYVGVKTTGVFCHSTCPARKPKFENCEFFQTSKEALLGGYRPCKRCNPLSNPTAVSPIVKKLVDAVENNPEKKWKNRDFEELDTNAVTARRQFQKKFGMTFVEYARSRRLGIALKEIKKGSLLIDAQLSAGFDSDSGFRDAFKNVFGKPISQKKEIKIFSTMWIDTKLGPMVAIADEEYLYLLEFVDRRGLEKELEKLRNKFNAIIIPQKNSILNLIERELKLYFENKLSKFETPICYVGSEFQIKVWEILRNINLGTVVSYYDIAQEIGDLKAVRAVGRANGMNQLSIIVPCHRVINKNGELGGYGGGIERKKWLLNHEGAKINESE